MLVFAFVAVAQSDSLVQVCQRYLFLKPQPCWAKKAQKKVRPQSRLLCFPTGHDLGKLVVIRVVLQPVTQRVQQQEPAVIDGERAAAREDFIS